MVIYHIGPISTTYYIIYIWIPFFFNRNQVNETLADFGLIAEKATQNTIFFSASIFFFLISLGASHTHKIVETLNFHPKGIIKTQVSHTHSINQKILITFALIVCAILNWTLLNRLGGLVFVLENQAAMVRILPASDFLTVVIWNTVFFQYIIIVNWIRQANSSFTERALQASLLAAAIAPLLFIGRREPLILIILPFLLTTKKQNIFAVHYGRSVAAVSAFIILGIIRNYQETGQLSLNNYISSPEFFPFMINVAIQESNFYTLSQISLTNTLPQFVREIFLWDNTERLPAGMIFSSFFAPSFAAGIPPGIFGFLNTVLPIWFVVLLGYPLGRLFQRIMNYSFLAKSETLQIIICVLTVNYIFNLVRWGDIYLATTLFLRVLLPIIFFAVAIRAISKVK